MSLDPEITQTVVRIDPVTHTKEVRTEYRESSAGWWTAAVIATVLILAGVYVLTTHDSDASQSAIQAAADQGRAQGMLEGAQAALSGASNSASNAANQAAAATAQAAIQAQQSANAAARSADQAAVNASASLRESMPAPDMGGQ